MRLGKVIKVVFGGIVAGLLVTLLIIYVETSRIPPEYRPPQLSAEQKDQAAKEFLNRKILREFGNAAQLNEPFEWTVTQDQLNRYLAAIDEIASSAPSVRPGTVYRRMEEAGLADPAVVLRDGLVRLMVRSVRHQKVLSVDVSLHFTEDGRLAVRLVQMRAGLIRLPDFWVRSRLEGLRGEILAGREAREAETGSREGRFALSSQGVGEVLIALLGAIEKEPISTELTWRVNRRHVRIDEIEITEGSLRLHVAPVGRNNRA